MYFSVSLNRFWGDLSGYLGKCVRVVEGYGYGIENGRVRLVKKNCIHRGHDPEF